MAKTNKNFPDFTSKSSNAFAMDEDKKENVLLNGMKVIFDKKVTAIPVNMDYNKNRKVF